MLTGAITVASGASTTLVASSRPPRPTSSSATSAGCCANRQKAAAVSISKIVIGPPLLTRSQCSSDRAQFVVADEHAAAAPADAKAFVEPHQKRRGENMDAQARGFEDRAQIGDRRTLAVGAGDMDHRRQFALGMIEPLQQPIMRSRLRSICLGCSADSRAISSSSEGCGLAAGAFTRGVLPARPREAKRSGPVR